MNKEEFEAFKKAWEEYPSQDNEGFSPDRGGFKCGWFAALDWKNNPEKLEIKEQSKTIEDEINEYSNDMVNMCCGTMLLKLTPQEMVKWVSEQSFRAGYKYATIKSN